MRIFTPSANKHANEVLGFVGISVAIILALSLISYSPRDASFNVSAPAQTSSPARNWIGPIGAHTADALLQLCGFGAFLIPAGILALSLRWFRSVPVESPWAKIIGSIVLFVSFPAELALLRVPDVRGALPPGGLLGAAISDALRAGFNPIGAHLVTLSCVLAALFLATQFSLTRAAAWLRQPFRTEGTVGRLAGRWSNWREAREAERLRRKMQEIKISGRPPVPPQRLLQKSAATLEGDEEIDITSEAKTPSIIRSHQPQKALSAKSGSSGPKITRGKPPFRLPSPNLLHPAEHRERLNEDDLKERARAIEEKCAEFDVIGRVTQINPGPVVTTFEFKPEAGIKYSRVASLGDDLCLALKAESILIERIPGKSTVGIEVPNPIRETITLREMVESPEFAHSSSKLTVPLGKDQFGRIRVADLTQMPHLLIAGATGTGKSVFLNSFVMAMLYKGIPDELKIVLVDPKRLELGLYEDIPHLHTPVVTDPKVAANVLRNATREMEQRLKLLAHRGVRNIDQYNRSFEREQPLSLFETVEDQEHRPLPHIVIVIDELADLMMVDTNGVEESITRLAQMARAVGIHLLLATQRPSVDVITGLIKANFPARISFRVASKVDSRTILDANGAESLLGNGDMLFLPAGSSRLHRIHGPLVTEQEITAVCDFWREQARAVYNEELLKPPKDKDEKATAESVEVSDDVDDELYHDAVRIVCEQGKASTSTLQRRLRIGYGRAARLIDIMEKDGIVGPPDGSKPREVLKKKDWMREFDESLH